MNDLAVIVATEKRRNFTESDRIRRAEFASRLFLFRKPPVRHIPIQPSDPTVRLIPLTNGQNAIVDSADYDLLSQWNWHALWNKYTKSWYANRTEGVEPNRRAIKMHRFLLGLEYGDKRRCDHANGNTLDCRRANLRIATASQNGMNQRRRSDNRSGFKGVRQKGSGWEARIMVAGQAKFLGVYSTAEDAHYAYREAAKEFHGEFARFE